jgi:environmental stress-induced protein Ves
MTKPKFVIARPQAVAIHDSWHHDSWQIVQLRDVAPTPWRNGGGVTRELLAWPNASDWIWRMSVAEVASSGPFSRFDGVQRWFAVLAGAGVRLEVAGQLLTLTCRSAPFCFDGAEPVACDLIDGATQDFNLMVRSGSASARMERVSGLRCFDLSATVIVAAYAGGTGATAVFDNIALDIPANCLAWRSGAAGAAVRLESADALWMEIAL